MSPAEGQGIHAPSIRFLSGRRSAGQGRTVPPDDHRHIERVGEANRFARSISRRHHDPQPPTVELRAGHNVDSTTNDLHGSKGVHSLPSSEIIQRVTKKIDIYDIADRLWAVADELRANSHLKAAEYSIPVLGLIFLKFADSRFTKIEAELAGSGTGRRVIGKPDYQARGVLYLPE